MIATKKKLDETDKRIIRGASDGLTAKEIGRNLNLSARTVEARIREMKKYYHCSSIAQLVGKLKKRA